MNNSNPIENGFRPIVGIDLGTTNSAIGYIYDRKPQILKTLKGERILPSVVLIDLEDNVVVGQDALDSLVAMPERTVAAVKRRMGSADLIHIAGRNLLPQEVSALILKELKKSVDDLYGEGEKEAVITVPSYFTDAQRRATKQAGELAGFFVERIINEPTAAALAYGLDNLKKDGYILVYDLGGGTFDVSVVELMSGILEVKASTGNNFLGGEDFDWRLVDWLAQKVIDEHNIDPKDDLRAKALLKHEAENIKIKLSSEESVQVVIPVVMVKDNQPIGLNTRIHRGEFINLIDDLLQGTIDLTQEVLKDADLSAADIDEILLVGGSTRIPRVFELISNLFGKNPKNDINPDETVALGAAVQAGLKSGVLSKSGLIATDVAPFSMGIAVMKEWGLSNFRPGGFAIIIPKNTTIPVTRSEEYTTTYDGQTSVSIEIYQGEHEWVKNNYKLGEFQLEGIPAANAGVEVIEVKFRYNLNGILEVNAKCISTGKDMTVTVQDALNRDSQKTLEDSMEKIKSLYHEEDKEIENFEDLDDIEEIFNLDDEEIDDEYTWESLTEEAKTHINDLNTLKNNMDERQQKQANKLILGLQEAIGDENEDSLQAIIEETIDFMIDLEL
ncbi:Hsp70 family protein [Dehalobacterium formicoaceticum]|uniref:Chaperone protein DnaK n=1 Tax=Dehalobacterium formicoaceticum TaxID=51515 RepID=A0ABT1Y042_9FIRM|nr:Hsp70 family protein [Dehalobacterium formicoaceticum]MCR6544234.1 Hsp70 family protein [Dehalobacterium formicoaceticum]